MFSQRKSGGDREAVMEDLMAGVQTRTEFQGKMKTRNRKLIFLPLSA